MSTITITIPRGLPRMQLRRPSLSPRSQLGLRLFAVLAVIVLLFTLIWPVVQHHFDARHYDLTNSETALLPAADPILQKDISRDAKTGNYSFQHTAPTGDATANGGAISGDTTMLKASFPYLASKGITVTDPVNNLSLTIKPLFDLAPAQQDSSHVYYPFLNGTGKLVYSPQAANVLEDIVLSSAPGDQAHFDYDLGLKAAGLAAKLAHDGSIGIYGSSISMLGNVSTGSASDAARLQKARDKASKDRLLFTIPAPTVKESSGVKSKVKVSYALRDGGQTLRVTASNLKQAVYPLTIDPTVSVQSVSQLFRDTNGESNVDFTTTGNGSVRRGAVTGGVFSYSPGWTTNGNNTATGHFLGSSTISNGYMYVGGGISGTSNTNQNTLEYAQISSPTVGSWQSVSLPNSTPLSQFKLLSYNGYLYSVGGSNGATLANGGCTNPTANVYYNPTQPNGAIASSWTATTALPVALCSFGAAIYNNTIYVIGGQTAAGAAHGVSTVYFASILPNGAIGAWNTSSPVQLPVSLYGADVQVYNGYIYVIGGYSNAASTATLTTIYRAALNSDGSIYGTSSSNWISLPNTFAAADGSVGLANAGSGNFSAVNDGYIYVSGGCNALSDTTKQICGTVNSATYIAQINADGTLGPWSQIASTTTVPEVGGSLQIFANNLYLIGGCSAMNATNFVCNTAGGNLQTQSYATITNAGQIGPVAQLGTNLSTALFDVATVVNNGYIYVIGGCSANACTTTSVSVYYASINAAGTIGSWTTSARKINNTAGLAGMGAVVYDNYIYLTGGFAGGSGTVATIWYAQITSSSNPELVADFASVGTGTTNQLPNSRSNTSTVLDSSTGGGNAYIYTFGGCTTGGTGYGCSTYYTSNYRYTVGATGPVVGSGTSSTSIVPALLNSHVTANNCATTVEGVGWTYGCYTGVAAMATALYGGYVYLAGGASNGGGNNVGQSSVIQYAKITNGTVGAWATASNYLPAPVRRGAAYATNGYLYIVGGHNALGNGGNGQTYQTVDIGKINLTTGNLNDINGITASSSQLKFAAWGDSVTYANGTVYEIGGCTSGSPPTTCSARSPNTQNFQIYNADNGGTATWASANNYNTASAYGASTYVTGGAAEVSNGYMYMAGGCTTYSFTALGNCTAATGATGYVAINPDGSLGTWAAGPTLPASVGYGCMVNIGSYLYYIGGVNASNVSQSTVYASLIGANGLPGAWTTTSIAALPGNRGHPGCDSFSGTIYVAGGAGATAGSGTDSASGTEGTDNNTVYYAQPNQSTGAITSWTSGTAFTTGRRDASVVAAGGYLYIIGGYSNSGTATYYNDVQYNSITPSTGALGSTWNTSRALPMPVTQAAATVANGYIFISGGTSGATTTTCQANTYIAAVNNTGEVSSWTQGALATNFGTARFGAAGTYYNGYYYVLGGYDCANSRIATTNIIQYGGEQSQSMNSFFTRYADLTGNAYPQKFVAFVTNAQVNSTDIESWKMTYISSMSGTTPSWGKATTISPIVSQSVYNVYAYDGSGNNVQLAQWVSLAFSISMEKSFSFTDDTQPYVSAYYMYYSPYAGARLRNGKTFQDQQQQGFDLNLR